MDDHSPHASGLCLCHEFKPTVHNAVPRAKRLLDSTEQVQALQSAKKACVLSHHCSTPDPSEKLLLCSPDSACFQGSSHFLDDTGHDDLVASSSVSKYNDVVISLDTTRCFDDSEPNDSLLELSDREEGNSPFSYTEEEIQEILADDCVESEWYLTRKSTLSQNVNGESERDESSSCTGASVISEDANEASENAEKPNVRLSSECSSVSSECYPSLLNERSVSLDENHLQSAQVTRMLFDLDIQELLSLSPIDADYVDQPLEDDCLEGAKKEASEAIINYCLEYDKTVGSCVLEETSEGLMSNGWQSLGVDCLGKTPFTSRGVSNFCGDHAEGSMSSSDLACGQSAADESSAPVLLRCPTPSSGSRNEELSKATKSCFSRKLDSPEDDEGESTEAEQPSNSIKLSDTAVGQIGQEETTSGKKPGKVIPVPQEEERLNQGTCILEAELKQKKHFFPERVHPYQENCSSYTRNYPRSNKKPTQRYSLTQWVSKNLAKHHYFQSILDCFQHSPVTAFSEV